MRERQILMASPGLSGSATHTMMSPAKKGRALKKALNAALLCAAALLYVTTSPSDLSLPLGFVSRDEVVTRGLSLEEEAPKPSSVDDDEGIRYVTFGTSSTWGAGILNRYDAYPYLLSSNVTNLAQRAGSPRYPSVCTQTMVGDDLVADVIVFEFFMRAGDGLIPLVKRLRQRFPDAIFVFLRSWGPMMVRSAAEYTSRLNVRDWAKNNNMGELHTEEFKKNMLESTVDWVWLDVEGPKAIQNEAIRQSGGYLMEIKRPENPKDLVKYTELTALDWFHFSERGHQKLAEGVKDIVRKVGVKKNPRVGTWGDGDTCKAWMTTGEYPSTLLGPNVQMEQFDSRKNCIKYAIRIPFEGGTVTVHNPADEPRQLYVGYMATGPAPSLYPKTEVTINDDDKTKVLFDPAANGWTYAVHVSVTTPVGIVQPGDNVLTFKPLERTELPFRVVSTSILGIGADDQSNAEMGYIEFEHPETTASALK